MRKIGNQNRVTWWCSQKSRRGFVNDLPIEDQKAISEIVGKPILLTEYDNHGRAELKFTDSEGVIQFILSTSTQPSSDLSNRKLLKHLAQNVLKDSAVLVVSDLERRIDAGNGGKLFFLALSVARAHFDLFFRLEILAQALEIENFEAAKPERLEIFTRREFQWQHSHADQIAAMDALETFRKHRANPEKQSSFRRPIARRA